jgi:hypothetical protein
MPSRDWRKENFFECEIIAITEQPAKHFCEITNLRIPEQK